MSIGVQSFPELYTLLMGWNLYDQLWRLLCETGIAFVPFIVIILRNILQPYASQETKDAASTSLRRMEIDILGTLLIIFLAVSPWLPLEPSMLSYTPLCQTNNQNNTYTPGNTGTTWDTAFAIPTQPVTVPLWWYAVIAVSEGIAVSANTMVACTPDLRAMVTNVDMTQVTEPELQLELQEFKDQCYMPARTRYFQDAQNNSENVQAIEKYRQRYGNDDTEWLGSHGFQNTYYQNLPAQQPIPGFAYDATQDINAGNNAANPPAYGKPTCSVWWNDTKNGLKVRLYHNLPKEFNDRFATFLHFDTNDAVQDNVVRKIMQNGAAANAPTGYDAAASTVGNHGYSAAADAVGTWFSQLSTYPKIYAAAQAAPIIQALLLLMVYTFLPFALVFSGYKPKAFLTGAGILFSLIFWGFIWHLVRYADTTLMNALYGNSWFSQQSPSATLADMITGMLVLIAPLFWFSFMGVMGVAIGEVVSKAFGSLQSSVGEKVAEEGTDTVSSIAKTIGKTATK